MNKWIYIIIIGFLTIPEASAQKTGYMGRRFMVKLNLVNGLRPQYFGGEVEYAIARRVTIGVGGGYQMGKYKQLYYKQSLETSGTNYLYYTKYLSTKKQAEIKAFSFYGQLKLFPFNRLKSAPDGFYFGFKVGAGYASIESKPGNPIVQYIYPSATNVPQSFNVKGIPFASYEFGPGIQKIFWGRFVVDANAYFNVSTFNKTGTNSSQEYTATVARQFGPNTVWLGQNYTDKTAPNGNVHKEDVNPREFTGNFGMSLYLKIGILIF